MPFWPAWLIERAEPIVFRTALRSVCRLPDVDVGWRVLRKRQFRWQPGTGRFRHCLGHMGYSGVRWKRGRGYDTQALGELLDHAKAEGLRHVEITTRPDNVPSQRVILANGGVLVEEFTAPAALGGHRHLRYRVQLIDRASC